MSVMPPWKPETFYLFLPFFPPVFCPFTLCSFPFISVSILSLFYRLISPELLLFLHKLLFVYHYFWIFNIPVCVFRSAPGSNRCKYITGEVQKVWSSKHGSTTCIDFTILNQSLPAIPLYGPSKTVNDGTITSWAKKIMISSNYCSRQPDSQNSSILRLDGQWFL